MVFRPFITGDEVTIGSAHGVVEEIGLRCTVLRNASGALVYVPNQVRRLRRRHRVIGTCVPFVLWHFVLMCCLGTSQKSDAQSLSKHAHHVDVPTEDPGGERVCRCPLRTYVCARVCVCVQAAAFLAAARTLVADTAALVEDPTRAPVSVVSTDGSTVTVGFQLLIGARVCVVYLESLVCVCRRSPWPGVRVWCTFGAGRHCNHYSCRCRWSRCAVRRKSLVVVVVLCLAITAFSH